MSEPNETRLAKWPCNELQEEKLAGNIWPHWSITSELVLQHKILFTALTVGLARAPRSDQEPPEEVPGERNVCSNHLVSNHLRCSLHRVIQVYNHFILKETSVGHRFMVRGDSELWNALNNSILKQKPIWKLSKYRLVQWRRGRGITWIYPSELVRIFTRLVGGKAGIPSWIITPLMSMTLVI